MANKSKQFCKYPSAFKLNRKLGNATMKYFNLSQSKDSILKCKNCIYKIRKTCSGAYFIDKQNFNKKKLKNSEIKKYNDYIKNKSLPEEIKIEVTSRCNLSCDFCFNINSFKRNSKELPTNQIFKIIDKIKKEGIKRIRFTGGEPFLRKDVIKIFEYAKSKNLYVKVNTNSTLIKKECIPKFKGIVDDFLLPLHSLGEDDIMKKTELIEIMKENNVYVRLNTVLIKENIIKLEKFFDIVTKMGVDWFLARPIPTINNKSPINNADVGVLIEKLIKFKNKYSSIRIENIPFCAYTPTKVKLFSQGAQNCGVFNKLVIDPTGKMKLCYSINKNLGNALKKSILDAWKHEFSADIKELRLFPGVCKECRYIYQCLGGCRFSAKLINGSYSALDPLAMPETYKEKLSVQTN